MGRGDISVTEAELGMSLAGSFEVPHTCGNEQAGLRERNQKRTGKETMPKYVKITLSTGGLRADSVGQKQVAKATQHNPTLSGTWQRTVFPYLYRVCD